MKTIFEHIEHVRGKPHHIRRRIAFTAAACGAAFIALVWIVGSLSTGAFAIKGSNFADSMGQAGQGSTVGDTSGGQLAGVGAAAALPQSANAPAHIEIIDASVGKVPQKKAEQTTIPF